MSYSALVVAFGAAACGDDAPAEPAAPTTFGPESLTVSLAPTPDSVFANTRLPVQATVRNLSRLPVVARLECPAGGLTVQAIGADGAPLRTSPATCPADRVNGTVQTLAPGDSVTLADSLTLDVAGGMYGLQAAFAAANGHSRPAESRLVVRSGPGLCTRETVLTVGPGTVPDVRWSPDCVVTSLAFFEVGNPTRQWVVRLPDTTLRSPQRYGVVPRGAQVFGTAAPLTTGQRYSVLLGLRTSPTNDRTAASTTYAP